MRFLPALPIALVLVLPSAGAGDCAVPSYETFLVTPDASSGVIVPRRASLLVGIRSVYNGQQRNPQDFPTLWLRGGRQRIELRVEVLTPMLARYVPQAAPRGGEYEVVGLGVRVKFARDNGHALPATPEPQVRAVQQRQEVHHYGERSSAVRLVLHAPPPSDAIAIMVGPLASAFGQALPSPNESSYVVYSARPCDPRPRAHQPPPVVGDTVEVHYIGADGRTGPPARVTVTQG